MAASGTRFLAGFAAASVLWAGAGAGLWALGVVDLVEAAPEAEAPAAPADDVAVAPAAEATPRKVRRRLRRGAELRGPESRGAEPRGADPRGAGMGGAGQPTRAGGHTTFGDDLRESEARVVDGTRGGGEEQLGGAEIDRAFDAAMGRVRRCLLLVPEDASASGRLVFGLRIAGSGRVTAVNLSGPAAVAGGEAGECLRGVARGLSFRRFDGPEMLVRYPIELD